MGLGTHEDPTFINAGCQSQIRTARARRAKKKKKKYSVPLQTFGSRQKGLSLGAFCRVVVAVVDSPWRAMQDQQGGAEERLASGKKGHRAGDELTGSAARCKENKTEVDRRHPAKV